MHFGHQGNNANKYRVLEMLCTPLPPGSQATVVATGTPNTWSMVSSTGVCRKPVDKAMASLQAVGFVMVCPLATTKGAFASDGFWQPFQKLYEGSFHRGTSLDSLLLSALEQGMQSRWPVSKGVRGRQTLLRIAPNLAVPLKVRRRPGLHMPGMQPTICLLSHPKNSAAHPVIVGVNTCAVCSSGLQVYKLVLPFKLPSHKYLDTTTGREVVAMSVLEHPSHNGPINDVQSIPYVAMDLAAMSEFTGLPPMAVLPREAAAALRHCSALGSQHPSLHLLGFWPRSSLRLHHQVRVCTILLGPAARFAILWPERSLSGREASLSGIRKDPLPVRESFPHLSGVRHVAGAPHLEQTVRFSGLPLMAAELSIGAAAAYSPRSPQH
jgi:hypothetical protein